MNTVRLDPADRFQVTMINADEGYIFSEFLDDPSDYYYMGETLEDGSVELNRGDLYRFLVKEYGRCTGRAYVGDGVPVGWVFLKRDKYEDSGETYHRETWFSLVTHQPSTNTPKAI